MCRKTERTELTSEKKKRDRNKVIHEAGILNNIPTKRKEGKVI